MINNFHDEYEFLSNFYMCQVLYEGMWYPSSEHAYQAAKTTDLVERWMVCNCKTPGQAKRMGSKKKKKITLRPGWNSMRYDVMLTILKSKFKTPELRDKLIATAPELLVEGNTWHDNFWGDCYCEDCFNKIGMNNLGLVLMTIRSLLKGEKSASIVCD